MSILSSATAIFFKKVQQTQVIRTIAGQQSPMLLDATLKESFNASAEPTQHPVEAGADITDHVILKPAALTLSGIITKTPFDSFPSSLVKAAGATVGSAIGSSLGAMGSAVGVVGGVAGAVGGGLLGKSLASSLFGSKDRELGDIAAEFLKIRDDRQPVDIQTGLQLYEGYVLASFTVSRDEKSGGSIKVDLEFKEMIIVENRITNVAIPRLKSALGKSSLGRQGPGDLDANKSGKGASILKKLFGGSS